MSFSVTITITGSTNITNFDIYQCTTSDCSSCTPITGSTGQDVSRVKLLTGHTVSVDDGYSYVKLAADTITCNNSICIKIIGMSTPTPTPTSTSTPIPTSTPTPTSTAIPPTSTPTPTSTAIPPTSTPTPTATNTPTPTPTVEMVGQCYSYSVPQGYSVSGYGLRLRLPGQSVQDVSFNGFMAELGGSNESIYYICSEIAPSYVNMSTGIAQTFPEEITQSGPNGNCTAHSDCVPLQRYSLVGPYSTEYDACIAGNQTGAVMGFTTVTNNNVAIGSLVYDNPIFGEPYVITGAPGWYAIGMAFVGVYEGIRIDTTGAIVELGVYANCILT